MATKYWFSFTPNPTTSANLSPTFLDFIKFDGTTLAPPGVTQLITGSGVYQFTYTPSFSIAFRIDGATTGLATASRYITGNVDINDEISNTVQAYGATQFALGVTAIAIGTSQIALGNTNVAIGTTLFANGTTIQQTVVNQGVTLVAIGNSISAFSSTLGVISGIGSTASIYGGASLEPGDLFGYLKWTKEFLSGTQSFNKTSGAWNIFSRNAATLLISKSLSNDANGVTRS